LENKKPVTHKRGEKKNKFDGPEKKRRKSRDSINTSFKKTKSLIYTHAIQAHLKPPDPDYTWTKGREENQVSAEGFGGGGACGEESTDMSI